MRATEPVLHDRNTRMAVLGAAILVFVALGGCATSPADPLPAWHEGPARDALLDYVQRVTDERSPDYIPPDERIAVFDNDGTLWAEQPMYVQLRFALDRIEAMAPDHPQWRTTPPFDAALAGDVEAIAAGGAEAVLEIVLASHAGMTGAEFRDAVRAWLDTARHPDTGRPYTSMVYQPMLEVLASLRKAGFRTWIVSGGGVEFMRVFAESVYGVPPEQVIGSRIATVYEDTDDGPVLRRQAELAFLDDKAGKPVAIDAMIGRRPVAAFGNSDGDLQMLRWTAASERPSLCVLIHHTDAEREWAYDRSSHIGRLDVALDEGRDRGWTIVDMRHDWRVVFPP